MKKVIFFLALILSAWMSFGQYINNTDETSFTFIAPDGATSKVTSVLFPSVKTTSYSYATNDTLTLEVNDYVNNLQVATLAGSFWLNLTIDDKVTAGAMMVMKFTCDGSNRKVYFNTGFATDSVTVTASTVKKLIAVYDGTDFEVIQ